jgi:hypothetical protein
VLEIDPVALTVTELVRNAIDAVKNGLVEDKAVSD